MLALRVTYSLYAARNSWSLLSIPNVRCLLLARWTRRGWQLTWPVSGSSPCKGACIAKGSFSSLSIMLLRYFFALQRQLWQCFLFASSETPIPVGKKRYSVARQ